MNVNKNNPHENTTMNGIRAKDLKAGDVILTGNGNKLALKIVRVAVSGSCIMATYNGVDNQEHTMKLSRMALVNVKA